MPANIRRPLFKFPMILLPAIHILLCALTAILSVRTAEGGWYRIIGIDPVSSLFMWVIESNLGLFLVFAILGSAKWYLIGLGGYWSWQRLISRFSSSVTALLTAPFVALAIGVTLGSVKNDLHEGGLSRLDQLQYTAAFLLCAGGVISFLLSAFSALGLGTKATVSNA